MRRVIEHLRERPEDERKAVAMFSAITVAGVLLAGWSVASLGLFTPARTSQTAAAAAAKSLEQAPASPETRANTPSVSIESIKKAYEAEVQKLKEIQRGSGR